MWKNQLKVGSKTFTKPKVKLTVDPNEDKCCNDLEEAWDNYIDMRGELEIPNITDCKSILKEIEGYLNFWDSHDDRTAGWFKPKYYPIMKRMYHDFKECEGNVESTTQS